MNQIVKKGIAFVSHYQLELKKTYQIQRVIQNFPKTSLKRFFVEVKNEDLVLPGCILPIRIYMPKKKTRKEGILFYHGGGWTLGSLNSYHRSCLAMAHYLGCPVISVAYRLAPEHSFPIPLEDSYKSAKFFFRSNSYWDVLPEDIVLMGDSAGANLVANISILASQKKEFLPLRQILLYPPVNCHYEKSNFPSVEKNGYDYGLTKSRLCQFTEFYYQEGEGKQLSPLLRELKNQPKTLLITAELDPLRDEGIVYGKKLEQSGAMVTHVEVKDTVHGFFNYSVFSKEREFVHQAISSFLVK